MGRRLLLVEGDDDFHVLSALFKAHMVPQSFVIEKAGGVEKLLDSIPIRLKASDLERFAVVIDADESIQKRWDQLKGHLVGSPIAALPATPAPVGTVLQVDDDLRVGIWIMPDNQVPGILEHFISFLVSDDDQLLPLVDQFIDGISTDLRRYPESRHAKARIHSWLALQHEPGKPLGQAVTAKYLDVHATAAKPFLEWIAKVFTD